MVVAHGFPAPATAALTLALNVALTGGLHVDGFTDTCDGIFSHRRGNELKRIMKDSRLGAMGATSLVLLLLLKFCLLLAAGGSVPMSFARQIPVFLLLMPVVGRSVLVSVAYSYRPRAVTGTPGSGAKFAGSVSLKHMIIAGTFTAAMSFLATGFQGLIALVVTSVVVVWTLGYVVRINEGISGDILGAACEMGELLWLMSYVALPSCGIPRAV